jgi:hypothetical protein
LLGDKKIVTKVVGSRPMTIQAILVLPLYDIHCFQLENEELLAFYSFIRAFHGHDTALNPEKVLGAKPSARLKA